jgi:hypothetical protein
MTMLRVTSPTGVDGEVSNVHDWGRPASAEQIGDRR